MKIKTTLTISAIALGACVFLQYSGITSAARATAGSFSIFSAPQNMGSPINTADMELVPTPAPGGLSFYFTSNRAGGVGGTDIWVSQRATLSSPWGTPQNLGATVNTTSNENVTALSINGREMFIQSNRAGTLGGNDLYLSTRTDPNNDLGWSTPVNLGPVINTTGEETLGSYFEDPITGSGTFYFLTNRPGGLGDLDLFRSTRNPDGTFNPPSPVTELNSSATESRAAISRDGLEIFFSSNRIAATQSVFVSTRASVSAPWNPPVFAAAVNNSGPASHAALSSDGTILYWSSNRAGGLGLADLYSSTRVSANRASTADFDGDGRTDLSVFRPSDGTWYVMESASSTFRANQFGANGDRVVPGDYDGDGRTDFAVVRQAGQNTIWYILRSSDRAFSAAQWGLNTDKPVPGDYDGDGRTDIAVYRDGTWYIIQSSNGQISYQQFGLGTDIPIAANGQ